MIPGSSPPNTPHGRPTFFCPTTLAAHTTIELPDALAHHAIRVLRLKPESDIVLFDGNGGQYPAKLIIDGQRGQAILGEPDPVEAEPSANTTTRKNVGMGKSVTVRENIG